MKRRISLLAAFLCITFFVKAQTPNEDSVWIISHYHKMETMIPMRDGVKLFTAIYIPNDTIEKHPILMMRTPYGCAPYGKDSFMPDWNAQRKAYYRENYIIVRQDVRGRYMSEGEYEDVRPKNAGEANKKETLPSGALATDEATDAYDAIEWLVRNVPLNNNKVGVWGISYPGFYATMAALSNHPSLKAVSPQAPVTDWFMGDDVHHNGAWFLMDNFDFDRRFGMARPQPLMHYTMPRDLPGDDNYSFFLKEGTLQDITHNLLGDSLKFWNECLMHPNYDEWWKARNARKYLENVKPAVLTVGGLFDAEDCFGTWETYKTIEARSEKADNKIVMGPWAHNRWALTGMDRLGNIYFGANTSEYYFRTMEMPFFNKYLKGKEDGNKLAEATIFFTGENKWRTFTEWPPKQVTKTTFFLRENGGLTSSGSIHKTSAFDEYISDPKKPVPYTEDVHRKRTREYMTDDQRFASRRSDVLVYESPLLERDFTMAGPISVNLFVTTTTTDADFVVKVIDVFPDNFSYADSVGIKYPMGGYQMLVRGEPMRGRFRNSFEKPEAFNPYSIEKVKFDMPDIAHTFKKGHRIMVQIQSSWFPLVDRNPQQFVDIYQCEKQDFVKSTIRIYHDSDRQSSITFPMLMEN